MRKYILLFLIGIIVNIANVSSQTVLKGCVIDSIEHVPIKNALIVIIEAKDSMLVTFTRTLSNGSFVIPTLKEGEYIVLFTSSGFADYTQEITVKTDKDIALGDVRLLTLAHVLQEVIVKGSIPKMRIKGDTTEYRADSFYISQNATVEELLKVLPGITVDSKGNISANGKRIEEVLVDGEPFFSDDPTIVTRNLRANIVDKVQVYNKKTDFEKFTGISGQQKTVVDLKLKADKKHGFFGNISFSAGNKGYHHSEAMFNRFSGNEKLSFFGIVSNTGTDGLSRSDINRYSDNSLFSNISEMTDPLDTWNGSYDGQGIPLLQTGGIHYNNKWNGDTQSVNINYRISNLSMEGKTKTEIDQLLDGKTFTTDQTQVYDNSILINRITGTYQFIPDSTSTLKLNINGNITDKNTNSVAESETRIDGNELTNTQKRITNFKNTNNTYSSNIIWMKRLRKKRRALSASVTGTKSYIRSSGYLNALNDYYTSTINPSSTDHLDQFKTNAAGESNLSVSFSYSEPLSQMAVINISYGQSFYNGSSKMSSFSAAADHSYTILDNTSSSDYFLRSFRQKINLQYTLTKKKYSLSFADEYNINSYHQDDRKLQTEIRRKFYYNNPFAQFFYSPNSNTSFSVVYTGSNQQPGMQQLQPVLLNLNPLNTYIGNPDLQPSYTHSFSFGYLHFILKNNQSISSAFSFSNTINTIGLNSSIDSVGRTVNQWENVGGSYFGNASLNYNTRLPQLDINAGGSVVAQLNEYSSVINGLQSHIRNNTYSLNLNVRRYKDKKYAFALGGGVTYTTAYSSLLNMPYTDYFSLQGNYTIDLYFFKSMQFHAEGSILQRQQVSVFNTIPTIYLIHAWLSKKFLKSQVLLLKVSANNILNTNELNARVTGPGYVSQTKYDVIGRYFMLSAAWNFSKNSKK